MFSYSISDFLAYDKSIWLAMVGRYLVAWWWLGGLASALLIVGIARWLARPTSATPGLVLLVLSLCWVWIAWRFHWHEHRSLNWAAGYWALAFSVQAGLLALAAAFGSAVSGPAVAPQSGPAQEPARLLVWTTVAVVFLGPALLGWLVDSTPFFGFEWFGLTPDATALMTLFLLILWRGGRRWLRAGLAVLPALSLAVSVLFSNSLEISSTAIFVGTGLVAMVALIAGLSRRSPQKLAAS